MSNRGGRQIAKAATLVMALFVLSRVLGLVRQMIIGALFGTSGDLDAYLAAARISEMVFLVITGGALGSAFIPLCGGEICGFRLIEEVEGEIELVLYYSMNMPGFGRKKFQGLLANSLKHAI